MRNRYNSELLVLADRSDGTRDDVIREWAFEPERYPTLCAYVRRGINSVEGIARDAKLVRFNDLAQAHVRGDIARATAASFA